MERRIESGMPGWKVARRIGEGSYSVVYEIERDNFGTIEKAAIKVISIPHSESEITEYLSNGYDMDGIASRFLERMGDLVKEYNTMVRLKDCPNIVHCDDYVTLRREDGVGWHILIRMELLQPLPSFLGIGAIEEKQALQLGLDIANALVRCRKEGIIHRDIKPQNIFVGKDGTYKLGDFGVARTLDNSAGATMIGTFNYMAPEVIQQKRYGFRADLYSLGLVLYWMLNERRGPFLPLPPKMYTALQEEDARARRFSGEPLPPPKHGSPRLKEIVLRACAYAPEDRYRNAEEMYADLYSLAENTAPRSYLPTPTVQVSQETPAESWQSPRGIKKSEVTQPAESSRASDSDDTQLAKGYNALSEEQTRIAEASDDPNHDRTQFAGPAYSERTMYAGPAQMQDSDRTELAGNTGAADTDRTQLAGEVKGDRTEIADSRTANSAAHVNSAEQKTTPKKKNRLVAIAGSLGIAAAIIFLICWRFLLSEVQPVSSMDSTTEQAIEETIAPEQTEEPMPEQSPEPTHEPTPVPTLQPTPEMMPVSTIETTPVPTLTPTPVPTPTPTPVPTPTPTPVPTPTPTPVPTPTPTPVPTPTPTPVPTPTPTPVPTPTPTPVPTPTPTPVPTPAPTPVVITETSSQEDILVLQDRLCELNWLSRDDATGIYNASTRIAVTNFQNSLKALGVDISATGYADELTCSWLYSDAAPAPTPAPQYHYRVNQYYYTAVDGVVNTNYDNAYEGEIMTTADTSMIISVPPSAIEGYVFAPESSYNVLAQTHTDPNAVYEYRAIYIRHTESPAFAIPENMKGIRISAGHDHSVVLKPDGTVLGFGSNVDDRNTRNVLNVNQSKVSGWSDIIDVSAGEYHSVGLKTDGTVVSVGQDKEGQRNLNKWKNIVDIAAGEYHTVGLKADGSLVAAGRNKKGQCEVQSLNYAGASRVIAVAAGYEHTIVLREDGTVSGIGDNSSGQRNVNSWTEIVSIDCGTEHTIGLRADGTVVAAGSNGKGQCNVSAWTDIIAIAAGDYFTIGLRSDGTVVAVGLNDEGQCNVEGWTDIVAIGAGNDHTLGVKIDGSGIGTGRNDKGQLSAFHVFS